MNRDETPMTEAEILGWSGHPENRLNQPRVKRRSPSMVVRERMKKVTKAARKFDLRERAKHIKPGGRKGRPNRNPTNN